MLRGFRLDENVRQMCPPVARAWWDQVNPKGAVELLEFTSSPEKGLGLKVTVDDLALTMPINPEGVWARFEGGKLYSTTSRPRMQVQSGTIEIDQSKLLFKDMIGTLGSSQEQSGLGSVPYRLNFEMTDLPDPQWGEESLWIERVLDEAPFMMTFITEGLRLEAEDGGNLAIDLPYAVADVLQRFQLTGGSLEMEIALGREPPAQPGEPAEITVNGKTYVRNATGAYEYFPYLLERVNAYIHFDTNEAKIEFLEGTGSDGAKVRVTGNITPLSDEASVSLSLATSDAPIDDRLRAAMPPEHQEILDSLFSRKTFELLESQGLLPDEEWLMGIKAEREQVVAEIRVLRDQPGAEEQLVQLRAKRSRLDTLLDMGVFQLGGLVVLDLQIKRAEGLDKPTYVTGTVDGGKVGLLYEEFPYPVWLINSVLRWTEKAIHLESKDAKGDEEDGLFVVTAGGGRGSMQGRFGLEVLGDEVVLAPQLFVQVLGDRVTPFLEAAIPPVGLIEPQDADLLSGGGGKALMAALNLQADLEYVGEVTGVESNGGGAANYDVMVRLKNGSAVPQEALASLVGAAGLFWPVDFALADLSGRIHVTPTEVQLLDLTGRHDSGGQGGAVQAEIRVARRLVSPGGAKVDAKLSFEDLALGSYLINLAPASDLEQARTLWSEFTPQGKFDASVYLESQQRGAASLRVDVLPKQIELIIDDHQVVFKGAEGQLQISDQAVAAQGLVFGVTTDQRKDGQVSLNGSYGLAGEKNEALALSGSWEGGQFASPVIPQLLRLIGDGEQAARYVSYDPDGRFNAEFRYETPRGGKPTDYSLMIEPINIGVTVEDVRVVATLDHGSRLALTPGHFAIEDLQGALMEGRFSAVGDIEFSDDLLLQMAFDYDGPLSRSLLTTLLPKEAREALESVAFVDHGTSSLGSCTLRIQQATDGPRYVRFGGRLTTSDVSFKAGMEFTDVAGQCDLVVTTNSTGTFWSADGELETMRLYGNLVENAQFSVAMKPIDGSEASSVELNSVIGEAYGGTVYGRASYHTGTKGYSAEVEIMDISLDAWFDDHAKGSPEELVAEQPSVGKGLFFGRLNVAGIGDDASSRHGRGLIQIRKGNMADNPITLGLVQLAQLGLPVASRLDFLMAPFYLAGNHLIFEEIILEATDGDSTWLTLRGEGTLELGSWELDTRLHSRSGMSMLLSPIADLGDQFIAIGVKGDIREPETGLIGFPGLSDETHWDDAWYRRSEESNPQAEEKIGNGQ